jgi:malate synthase
MRRLQERLRYEKSEIVTEDAASFLEKLHDRFESRRKELLHQRTVLQKEFDEGKKPNFLEETRNIRESNWTVAPVPADLQDRRVEITGPASDPKMVINAFNSGAKVFMADFEDANSPTYENCIQGQISLRDAINGTLNFTAPNGKHYKLNENHAVLLVRPRGWHLTERHFLIEGEPISGGLFDFGLFLYHNAKTLIEKGSGPYFYLPKLENAKEAKLWNDVFIFAQDELGIPQGTIKATVLIETITAAFEADEILYELKEHSAGLNCGRWDYIFSTIKKFRSHKDFILPDRALVTMEVPFMRAYTLYVVKTCHKRNAHAIGGMAAQIPVKNDEEANRSAFEKVRKDKEREANDGFDGSWVAHPGLVPTVLEVFNEHMPTPNQVERKRDDVRVTAGQLVEMPDGDITESGLRTNINVGIQYIEAWLLGRGAVPLFNLMEDAATAEISRAQVWQWIRHEKGILNDGRKVTFELVDEMIDEELEKIKIQLGEERFENGKFDEATALFRNLIEQDEFLEFLTIPGYEKLN